MNTVLLISILVLLVVLVGVVLLAAPRVLHFLNGQPGSRLEGLEKTQEKIERSVKEEIAKNRDEWATNSRDTRSELNQALKANNDSILSRMAENVAGQVRQHEIFVKQLTSLTQNNDGRLEKMRETIERHLDAMQKDNSEKLEKMRATVDEKLHATLEKRLGESFKIVSDRLELVHKGLGEMQTLATGVGDLKKVLSNVKTRGILGEGQLGNILEEIFTPDQYARNIITKTGSSDPVEFAIKLPGSDEGTNQQVWLPIDSKFNMDAYERLIAAQEKGDLELIDTVGKELERTIKAEAMKIRTKYVDPPRTTDFAILFLPTESLFAEVLRRPGLFEILRRDHNIIVTGPMTLTAILSSLLMGFKTLAIQKRSSEIWSVLSAVKTEFGRFGDLLDRTHKKLQEASNVIDEASKKSRTIERKLLSVQQLPVGDSEKLMKEIAELPITKEEELPFS